MKDKCVLCQNEEFHFYKGNKYKFFSKNDFVCSKCTLTLSTTPRGKLKRLPKDFVGDLAELENLLSGT